MQHFSVACGRYYIELQRQKSHTENTYGLIFERDKINNGGGRDTASNRIRTAHSISKDLRNIELTFHFHKMDGYSM